LQPVGRFETKIITSGNFYDAYQKVSTVHNRPRRFGANALGARARGAFALGALAIGSLVVSKMTVGKANLKSLSIEDLAIARLQVRELTVINSLYARCEVLSCRKTDHWEGTSHRIHRC
jgi:hypothetical protein